MSKLCINLPPYAPDYSGCASALFELGGMIVLHDASGCTGNYLGYDEPRWMGSDSFVFCSGLRHMDAILGNDNLVIDRIIKAAKSLKPKFIALLGSPVPMVIGTDYEGIAREVESKTGIPSFGFDTKGLAYYGNGISRAATALIKRFAKKGVVPEEKRDGINIIGMTPLDFGNKHVEKDIIALFENAGIKVNCCFSLGHSLEAIEKSSSSRLNVVVSQSGIETARFMKQKYGIPFITGTPVGDGKIMVDRVKAFLESGTLEDSTPAESVPGRKKILIAGDQIISRSLCEEAEKRHPQIQFVSGTLFDFSDEEAKTGEIRIKDETEFRALVNSGEFSGLVADPLAEQLFTAETKQKMKFFPLANVAVSSKVFWNDSINILGSGMNDFISKLCI
ncbi:nitrogenase component 1 [Treponema sp.]|uniref:nitrogenase component 1 n=1 Tax=Treponema sp. TaxID=166 RepID=UPI00388EAC5A